MQPYESSKVVSRQSGGIKSRAASGSDGVMESSSESSKGSRDGGRGGTKHVGGGGEELSGLPAPNDPAVSVTDSPPTKDRYDRHHHRGLEGRGVAGEVTARHSESDASEGGAGENLVAVSPAPSDRGKTSAASAVLQPLTVESQGLASLRCPGSLESARAATIPQGDRATTHSNSGGVRTEGLTVDTPVAVTSDMAVSMRSPEYGEPVLISPTPRGNGVRINDNIPWKELDDGAVVVGAASGSYGTPCG